MDYVLKTLDCAFRKPLPEKNSLTQPYSKNGFQSLTFYLEKKNVAMLVADLTIFAITTI